eukprot:CAMPEP_0194232680 /NCGR_PEP_ID=MMETSP0158-20130606/961_1 /TAXON_ID=33649 /ORGANISM="Thalassionema nitzschioides, Strain L26-B" /LENGTH=274 /DNA_ID=CAMNT_0038965477 /DNA_START=36 /DNA_END=860 /DNA_ORIENTATION=+
MLTLRVLSLSCIVAIATAQPGCTLCVSGDPVGNPDALYSIPGIGPLPCGQLEAFMFSGQLQPCEPVQQLPRLQTTCECPVSDGCSICGDGKEVGAPDAIFVFPGQPAVPCGLLEEGGREGTIPLAQCKFLVTLPELDVCECQPIAPIPAPITSPPVTSAPDPESETVSPVVPPTQAPATAAPIDPTAAPVDPTAAPIDPTQAPVDPTAAPVDPTQAPVDPTAAPVDLTQAPVVAATNAPSRRSKKGGSGGEKKSKKLKVQKQKSKVQKQKDRIS